MLNSRISKINKNYQSVRVLAKLSYLATAFGNPLFHKSGVLKKIKMFENLKVDFLISETAIVFIFIC